MDEQLNKWTARFASSKMEAAFQHAKQAGDYLNNLRALMLAIPIFAAYALLDFLMIEDPEPAIRYRLSACAISAVLLLALRRPALAKHQEAISCLIMAVMSSTLFFILHTRATIDHNYYVGLVQGGVFVCFLLRVGFVSAVAVLSWFLLGFAAAFGERIQTSEVAAQLLILCTMFLISGFGNYLLQRYRRSDFLKSRTIEQQNTQLKLLLDDVRKDNTRKIAAINTLVHFVKTPLHQINGFSEILVRSSGPEGDSVTAQERAESAKYIKNATASLSSSVNKLLAYHRLDEIERQHDIAETSLDDGLSDFVDLLDTDIKTNVEGPAGEIKTIPVALKTALDSLAAYFSEPKRQVSKLKIISTAADGGDVTITIEDNGAPLSSEEFLEEIKPLTKIDNYLSGGGSEMPMSLRTVARAVELMRGELAHTPTPNGNSFSLRLSDYPATLSDDQATAA